jgi:hypothetical protein
MMTRARIQQRAVKMAILAQIMVKRHQRARKSKKTAQRTRMEVIKVAKKLIQDLRLTVVENQMNQLKTNRTLTALVETLQTQVKGQTQVNVILRDRIKRLEVKVDQEQGKAQVERVLLRNRILDLEAAVARLITRNQVK